MSSTQQTEHVEIVLVDEPAREQRDYWRERAFRLTDERDAIDRAFLAWRQRAYERCPELLEVSNQDRDPASSPDPTEGLPPDLARILRDPTITIGRDHEIRLADGRTLFEHLEEWRNAPSNTASASLPASEPTT